MIESSDSQEGWSVFIIALEVLLIIYVHYSYKNSNRINISYSVSLNNLILSD